MLLKGCQKRIICLQSADSRLFREAFFVLRADCKAESEEDILAEANRILDENILRRAPKKDRFMRLFPALALAFLSGALATGAFWLLFALL